MTTVPHAPAGEPELPYDPDPVPPELPEGDSAWTRGPHNDPVEPA